MPPQAQAMMKSQIGQANTTTTCLTREMTERSEGEMFRPPKSGDCKFSDFSMGTGTIAGEMTCDTQGGSRTMKMTGTYGAEAYAMKVSSEDDMGEQKISMVMEIASKRVGDCDGSETG
jgi:hypothetical protein